MSGSGPQPYRALFILPSLIGDSILTTGLIRHVRERHPGAALTIATSPLAVSLFAEIEGVERVIPFSKGRYKSHWLRLWPKVFRRWDVVVDMRGSILSFALPARRRIVHKPPKLRDSEHRVVSAGKLVGRGEEPPAPLIECRPATDARAAALVAGEGPLLALAPGATWQGKIWPADRFVDLATTLLARNPFLAGGRVMLVGGPKDDALTAPLNARLGADRVLDLTGLDLLTTFACLRRVRLFVGNDSGMMHTAATAGAPTLGLFGPSPDVVFHPFGRATAIARGPRPHAAFGMGRKDFDWAANHMGDLDLATALAAAEALLARTASPHPAPTQAEAAPAQAG